MVVLIPCFNEKDTIEEIVNRINDLKNIIDKKNFEIEKIKEEFQSRGIFGLFIIFVVENFKQELSKKDKQNAKLQNALENAQKKLDDYEMLIKKLTNEKEQSEEESN